MARKGVFSSLVLAGILAVGAAVVWGLLSLWAVFVVDYVARPAAETESEALVFLADGTALVASFTGRRGERRYRDLDGNAVPAPGDGAPLETFPKGLPARLPLPQTAGVSWQQCVRAFADGRSPAVFWYFLADGRPDGTGYFAGYDSKTNHCVGYLGTAGFRAEVLPREELFPYSGPASGERARVFCAQKEAGGPTQHPRPEVAGQAPRGSISTWDVYVLGSDRKIYHADLHARTVHVALDEPGLRSAVIAPGPTDPVRGTPHRLAARIDDAVLLLDERGRLLKRYPIPEALRERDLGFLEAASGEAVLRWNSPFDDLADEVEYRICWSSADGRWREKQITLRYHGWLRPFQVLGGVVTPSPLVLGGLLAGKRSSTLLEEGLAASYSEALGRALTEFAPALGVAQLAAVALALLCWRRQVRYAATRWERVVWPVFVLVLGLPGWVGYRFGRSWPALEACPACGVDVPGDRECCVHCEAEQPRPALKGTEVFA